MTIEQACAKINLALDVTGKRENGYHEVKMIMQSIDLCDDLVFEKLPNGSGLILETDSGILNTEQAAGTDNLIVKAARLLGEYSKTDFDVKIILSKRIPIAAGLAGGSADAAATLRGLNRLFELNLSNETLQKLAVKLGADVPFCVEGGLCLCEGIGEILTPLTPLPSCPTVICKPPVFVSTKEVYSAYDALTDATHPDIGGMLEAISQYDAQGVSDLLSNTLECVTKRLHPVIGEIEEKLMKLGAVNSVMSGSGPTVFGIFFSEKEAAQAADKLKEIYPDFEICSTKFKNAKPGRFE